MTCDQEDCDKDAVWSDVNICCWCDDHRHSACFLIEENESRSERMPAPWGNISNKFRFKPMSYGPW